MVSFVVQILSLSVIKSTLCTLSVIMFGWTWYAQAQAVDVHIIRDYNYTTLIVDDIV